MSEDNRSIRTRKYRNGFTLAELLIVVAIIAVLVAISIPTFATLLENARNRTDAYNAKAMADAIQVYFMTNPDEIETLKETCKTASRGYVQICVGPVNTAIDEALKPALAEAGLLPKQAGIRYALKAQSKRKWIGYYIAVAGPVASAPGVVRIEFAGIPVNETNIPYKYYASYYWPNRETTGFNDYARGRA